MTKQKLIVNGILSIVGCGLAWAFIWLHTHGGIEMFARKHFAVASVIGSSVLGVLMFLKEALALRKLRRELAELKRKAEAEKNRLTTDFTTEEIIRYSHYRSTRGRIIDVIRSEFGFPSKGGYVDAAMPLKILMVVGVTIAVFRVPVATGIGCIYLIAWIITEILFQKMFVPLAGPDPRDREEETLHR